MKVLKANLNALRKKIIDEYDMLSIFLETAMNDHVLSPEEILDYSEYFYIKMRIYLCFKDFTVYMQQMDDRIISFLLKLQNTSDYLSAIYENGLAGDCDVKSVEGIQKLMIFSYNNAIYRTGRSDFAPVEITFWIYSVIFMHNHLIVHEPIHITVTSCPAS